MHGGPARTALLSSLYIIIKFTITENQNVIFVIGKGRLDSHKSKQREKACNISWKIFPSKSMAARKATCKGFFFFYLVKISREGGRGGL